MQPNLYPLINTLVNEGRSFVVCTVISSAGSAPRHVGSKMVVLQDGTIHGTVGGGEMEHRVIQRALECLQTGLAETLEYKLTDLENGDPGVCGGQVGIFLEPQQPAPRVVVVGAGHVGKAVAKLAKWIGFAVTVSDDRAEFCNSKAVPDADEFIVCALKDLAEKITLGPNSYVLLTTRGVRVDVPGLPNLLASNAGYIGIIGSKRRWLTTREQLLAEGVSQELIARVHSPIGINIRAETPEEIALSILAEVMIFRAGTAGELMDINSKMGK